VFVLPLVWKRPYAEIVERVVHVDFGWAGSAAIPVSRIAAASTFTWPWWGGLGVRLGAAGLVAFVARSGEGALLDLTEPVRVKMPLGWDARRVLVNVEDVDRFLADVAAARLGIPLEEV
jgi:hypothetical protein